MPWAPEVGARRSAVGPSQRDMRCKAVDDLRRASDMAACAALTNDAASCGCGENGPKNFGLPTGGPQRPKQFCEQRTARKNMQVGAGCAGT